MPVYSIQLPQTGRSTTVQTFLCGGTPPRMTLPQLNVFIQKKHIIHYTRGNKKTVVTAPNHSMKDGDFLIAPSQASTGANQIIRQQLFYPTDYAFIMGDTVNDAYYRNAQAFMTRRPSSAALPQNRTIQCGTAQVTTNKLLSRSIHNYRALEGAAGTYGLLEGLASESQNVVTPVADVLIVSHGFRTGVLHFRLRPNHRSASMYQDILCPYAKNANRTKHVTVPQVIQNKINVHIRGCGIGNNTQYLTHIKTIFDNKVTVTAPKHFQTFGFVELDLRLGRNPVVLRYRVNFELMQYWLYLPQKSRMRNKNSLVTGFFNKGTKDIHNSNITRTLYNRWIPNQIHPQNDVSRRRRFTLKNAFITQVTNEVRAKIQRGQFQQGSLPADQTRLRNFMTQQQARFDRIVRALLLRQIRREVRVTYSYAHETLIGPFNVPASLAALPAQQRLQQLKQRMANWRAMKNNFPSAQCNYPRYQRAGYTTFNDFFDAFLWTFRRQGTQWRCQGSQHYYEIKVPILDQNNNLLLNAVNGADEPKYLCQDILETNTQFFGRVT